MNIDIGRHDLSKHVKMQLNNLFGQCDDIEKYLDMTLQKCELCFKMNKSSYYHNEIGEVTFSPFHSGQYSVFLYYLSNTIHVMDNNKKLATVVYYLNKVLHSVDWYYEISLPQYWGVEHPVSSVLGRANYSNGLFIYQGCTVGGNKGNYPIIGKNVILYANSTVIGNSKIGSNVLISTGTIVKDDIVPDNCIVFGQSPNLIIKNKNKEYIDKAISDFWIK